MTKRRYSDDDRARAVAASRSWRGVLRGLGSAGNSAAGIRSVRRRADLLGIDHSHFTGQRRWSEAELTDAVRASRTWTEVAGALGLAGGSSTSALKGHALRWGIDTHHLGRRAVQPRALPTPDLAQLPRAGASLAAARLALCGFEVSWPLEPCRDDLVALRGGDMWRIQVKTTRWQVGGSWVARASTGAQREPYDPDELDYFYFIDGDLMHYLVPVDVVAGLSFVSLSAYRSFRLPNAPVT